MMKNYPNEDQASANKAEKGEPNDDERNISAQNR